MVSLVANNNAQVENKSHMLCVTLGQEIKLGIALNGLGINCTMLTSWPENQGILFFRYFSNTSNEPDIFHGCTS